MFGISKTAVTPPATAAVIAGWTALVLLALKRRSSWPLFSLAVLWFVTAHAIGQGIGMRQSISNYMYNQTGHFAAAGRRVCL